MAKILRTSYSLAFNNQMAAGAAMGETNDCAVKAVSLACDVDYTVAHATLKRFGRKDRKGTFRSSTRSAVNALGFYIRVWGRHEHEALIASYPKAHQILKSITTHHPRRFAKRWSQADLANKTFLFFTAGHVAVVKGGQLHDWTVNSARPVLEIWEITK